MPTLNNNSCATIINEAIAQSLGKSEVDTLDLSKIIDNGNDDSIIGSRESFCKALLNVITKNWFEDSSYRSQYADSFFESSERFGAIIQSISVEVPEVKESHAWKDFTPTVADGTTTYATAGVYNLYLPVANCTYYGKSISWELPIAITNEQFDTAFKSESDIKQFVNYILLCVDNAIVQHLENMNNANRNAFIAEKILASADADVVGLHKVNLVEEYQGTLETPASMTVEEFLNDEDALRFASEYIANTIGYMSKMNTLYNVAGRQRFVPKDRMVIQILSAFKNRYNRVALSNAFNKELDDLPLAEVVPYWQGVGGGATFNEVSSIDVKVSSSNSAVTQSGIIGFIADKWAIMHSIKNHRVAATYFDPEAVTQYYYQFRDSYMNNLSMSALVLTVEDFTVSDDEDLT